MPEPRAILEHLGIDGVDAIDAVTGGADAALYRVATRSGRYALRVLDPDRHEQAARENRYLRHATANGVPGPDIVASGIVDGHPATLMTWIDGTTLADAVRAGALPPEAASALLREFGAVQARIHAIPAPPDSDAPPTPWERFTDSELRAALARVEPLPPALLHLDYHPLNVLVQGGAIVAVLDWANAAAGDPRFDVARTRSILTMAASLDPGMAAFLEAILASVSEGYGAIEVPPVFAWWAWTVMDRDLQPKVGSDAVPWLDAAYMQRVRDYAAQAREDTLRGA